MKKTYLVPSTIIEELEIDTVLVSLSESDAEDRMDAKGRVNTSNYKHEDLGWDY